VVGGELGAQAERLAGAPTNANAAAARRAMILFFIPLSRVP
jgi:hypothetical protein